MLKIDIIKKIVNTSESIFQKEANNTYVFSVDPSCNKFQLKIVLEELFNVRVQKICTSLQKPAIKSRRRMNYSSLKKKAFVKLKPGYRI